MSDVKAMASPDTRPLFIVFRGCGYPVPQWSPWTCHEDLESAVLACKGHMFSQVIESVVDWSSLNELPTFKVPKSGKFAA